MAKAQVVGGEAVLGPPGQHMWLAEVEGRRLWGNGLKRHRSGWLSVVGSQVVTEIRGASRVEWRCEMAMLCPHGIFKDDPLVVPFALTLGLDAVLAPWLVLVTLNAALAAGFEKVRGRYAWEGGTGRFGKLAETH